MKAKVAEKIKEDRAYPIENHVMPVQVNKATTAMIIKHMTNGFSC
jgi:hypothetical protein